MLSKFDYESAEIKDIINHRKRFELAKYRKYKMKRMEVVNEVLPTLDKSDYMINLAIKAVERDFGITFTQDQMVSFAKLHAPTFYWLSEEDLISESPTSLDHLHDDLCNFFVEFPAIKYGHNLTEAENKDYYQYVKDSAKIFGFEVKGYSPGCDYYCD